MAEAILSREGIGRFRAYSAGSLPSGEVNPRTIELLERLNYPVGEFRSKSWDEFAASAGARISTSSSPSATTPRARCAPPGRASR